VKVGIVGAGLAGLIAGRAIAEAGHDVVLWDKGRSPGGRLATRRIGDARLDHGAQFFTVRTDEFARHVAAWEADGIVREHLTKNIYGFEYLIAPYTIAHLKLTLIKHAEYVMLQN
jgi:predicted NAD/FAD-dependent oxidoreductase